MKHRNLIIVGVVILHWALLAIALIWRGHTYSLHLLSESLLLNIIWIADLPTILILSVLGIEINTSLTYNPWWLLLLAIIAISLQWIVLGIAFWRFTHVLFFPKIK